MKILFYQDYLRVGGTEAHTLHLSRWVCENGHQAVVLTNRPGGRLSSAIIDPPVALRTLQPFQSGVNFWAPGWRSAIHNENPDAIILMGRVANSMGNPIRSQFPDIPVIASLRTGRPIPAGYRKSLQQSGKIIVNSQWAATRAESLGIDASKVAIVYNPFLKGPAPDPEAYERLRCQIRTQAGCRTDSSVLLCVASFVPGKNQEGLLRTLASLPANQPIQVWFVGEGPRMKRARELSETLPRHIQSTFWGHRSDVTPFYCGADLAVSASLEESLPNFLVEAQYHGLPIIAYDEAGVRECFIDGKTGLLIPRGDSRALQSALIRWLGEDLFSSGVSSDCKEFARSRFDPEKQSRLWLDIVLEFASRR